MALLSNLTIKKTRKMDYDIRVLFIVKAFVVFHAFFFDGVMVGMLFLGEMPFLLLRLLRVSSLVESLLNII